MTSNHQPKRLFRHFGGQFLDQLNQLAEMILAPLGLLKTKIGQHLTRREKTQVLQIASSFNPV
jgi:hypothetical protein